MQQAWSERLGANKTVMNGRQHLRMGADMLACTDFKGFTEDRCDYAHPERITVTATARTGHGAQL